MWRRVRNLLLVGPIAITIYDNIGYPAIVEGPSMQPTLNPDPEKPDQKDVVFINRFVVRDFAVRKNDIVALMSPKNPSQRIIKRVIGTEGDVVRTRRYKDDYVDIPRGHFWAESDNSKCLALDSNVFGPVSTGLVIGRATHIVWPPSRWRRLDAESDPLYRRPVTRRPLPDVLSGD